MSFKASFVLILSAFAFLPSNATKSSAELYWKTKLGNIPMPKVLKDSLQLDAQGGKVDYAHPADLDAQGSKLKYAQPADQHARGDNVYYAHPADLDAQRGNKNYAHPADLDARRGNKNYAHPADLEARGAIAADGNKNYAHPADLDALRGNKNYAHPADLNALRGNKNYAHPDDLDARGAIGADGNKIYAHPVDLDALRGNKNYAYPADLENGQDHDAYTVPQYDRVIYFTYEQLFIAGSKMKLHFRKINDGVKFLPLHVAKSITIIASNKLQMILNILSVNKKSTTAQYIENTIKDCEERGVKDEVRFCATSLESMVDNILNLNSGKNKLMLVSTEEERDILMEYKIQKVEKLGKDDNQTMVCHKLENPYAVFLCHNIKSTNVYGVSLVAANKKQMTAIVVCHKDTSAWNPKHLAFQLLKLKPGSKPICHFLSGDAIVWLRN